jgi:hypothetical protein
MALILNGALSIPFTMMLIFEFSIYSKLRQRCKQVLYQNKIYKYVFTRFWHIFLNYANFHFIKSHFKISLLMDFFI